MMSYSNKDGVFPFTKNELDMLYSILSEREEEIKESFEDKDPHTFIKLVQLKAKIDGYIWLIEEKEENK